MTDNQNRYEVYIEKAADMVRFNSASAKWSWCKMNRFGLVTVRGSRHSSLEACFAAVRKHRSTFGDAPIAINLRRGDAGAIPAAAILPVNHGVRMVDRLAG